MRKAILVDEFDSGAVSVWSFENFRIQTLPHGTQVKVLGPRSLSGYIAVEAKGQIFEVWHENIGSLGVSN